MPKLNHFMTQSQHSEVQHKKYDFPRKCRQVCNVSKPQRKNDGSNHAITNRHTKKIVSKCTWMSLRHETNILIFLTRRRQSISGTYYLATPYKVAVDPRMPHQLTEFESRSLAAPPDFTDVDTPSTNNSMSSVPHGFPLFVCLSLSLRPSTNCKRRNKNEKYRNA